MTVALNLTLKTEAVWTSETLIFYHNVTQHHSPKELESISIKLLRFFCVVSQIIAFSEWEIYLCVTNFLFMNDFQEIHSFHKTELFYMLGGICIRTMSVG